jgi:hypothetical protein
VHFCFLTFILRQGLAKLPRLVLNLESPATQVAGITGMPHLWFPDRVATVLDF